MNWSEQSPQLLLFSVIAVWCIGFIAMVLGKKFNSKTASITAIVVTALFLILMSIAFFLLVRDFAGAQRLWTRGWIGPRDLEGAITVGILEDPLGLMMIILSSVLTLIGFKRSCDRVAFFDPLACTFWNGNDHACRFCWTWR
jgi:NADH:ubiquinone oxidoreductase subunit 4 (subunit M)